MKPKIEWIEVLLVGAVSGLVVGCLGLALRFGATTDNLLNFLGSAVGSGTAVVAALWLESHRRKKAFERLVMSLVGTATVAIRFRNVDKKLLAPLIVTLNQSVQAFEATKTATEVSNPLHQYGLQSCIFWMKKSIMEMQSIEEKRKNFSIDDAQYDEFIRRVAELMVGPVDDFLSLDGVPEQPRAVFATHKGYADEVSGGGSE